MSALTIWVVGCYFGSFVGCRKNQLECWLFILRISTRLAAVRTCCSADLLSEINGSSPAEKTDIAAEDEQ